MNKYLCQNGIHPKSRFSIPARCVTTPLVFQSGQRDCVSQSESSRSRRSASKSVKQFSNADSEVFRLVIGYLPNEKVSMLHIETRASKKKLKFLLFVYPSLGDSGQDRHKVNR